MRPVRERRTAVTGQAASVTAGRIGEDAGEPAVGVALAPGPRDDLAEDENEEQ